MFSYQNRIYASILLISLLPLAILGVFAYATYVTELSEKVDLSIRALSVQTGNRVDNVLTSIREHYGEIFQDPEPEIAWLTSDDVGYNKPEELSAVRKKLRGPLFLVEYISGYSYINLETDWAVGTTGMFPLSEATNRDALLTLLEESQRPNQRAQWLNLPFVGATTPVSSNRIKLEGYTLLLRLPAIGSETKGALLVNLNNQELARLALAGNEGYQVVVLDRQGLVLSDNMPELAAYCADNLYKILLPEADSVVRLESGAKYRIAAASSDSSGLVYVVGYNDNLVAQGADRILTLLAVLAVTMVLIIFLSRLGTRVIYRPVSRLTAFFEREDAASKDGSDEFERIERGVEALVDTNSSMERVIDSQRGMLTELFGLRLLRGELSEEQIASTLRSLSLEARPCHALMAVRFISPPEGVSAPGETTLGEDALRIAAVETLPPEFLAELYMPPIINANTLILSVAADDPDTLDERILTLYELLTLHASRQYGCPVLVGVSRMFESLSLFRKGYHESLEALKNGGFSHREANGDEGESGIVFYSDLIPSAAGSTYSTLAEREVQSAIDQCDAEKAAASADRFVESLQAEGVSLHEQDLYLHRFVVAILVVVENAGLSVNEVYSGQEGRLFDRLSQLYQLQQVKGFLREEVIRPAIAALEQFRRGRAPEILEQVLALVKERRGNITLNECADQLGYHPSYIWKVLKTQKDMTFSDFVSWEKVELAKEMLLETDLPIGEIASQLGYTNAQNFIRFFSRHEGTTPGKFRKSGGNGAAEE